MMQDAESESAAMLARKPPQKMTTARRSRAAEVHNLSERVRDDNTSLLAVALVEQSTTISDCLTWMFLVPMQRRRDRINEKMRALQELIPHCNKVSRLHWTRSSSIITFIITCGQCFIQ